MALKDLLAMVDDKLAEVFDRKAYDPSKDRDRFAKRIDATKTKFLQTEPARGQKDFTVANGVVRYEPTLRGNPVVIGGRMVFHIDSGKFVAFLDGLKSSVEGGELDDAIEAAATDDAAPAAPKAARKPREGGGSRGWSDERRAAFAATIAARKAGKN